MIQKRKDFLINSAYVGFWMLVIYLLFRFTFRYMMPFVFGFLIAFMLKPLIRRLNQAFGENKIASIIVTILFYIILTVLITWSIVGLVALIQHYIPLLDAYFQNTIFPMANDLFVWFQSVVEDVDPRISGIINRSITELEGTFQSLIEVISKTTLGWVTALVTSTPRLLISILISVISSFFFSIDYQNIVNKTMEVIPKRGSYILMEAKYLLTDLLAGYGIAYLKLMSLTFLELALGFFILRINNPIRLAALVALVDILPVLGTGTILIPWIIYELILGSTGFAIGLLVIYVVITIVRNVLEPRVIGKQIGLHPLLTLVSIFVGLGLFGFWGLFIGPLSVTVLKRLHDEGKLSLIDFFRGDVKNLENDASNY